MVYELVPSTMPKFQKSVKNDQVRVLSESDDSTSTWRDMVDECRLLWPSLKQYRLKNIGKPETNQETKPYGATS